MFVIEINKIKYAVGLTWSRLSGEKVSSELSALSKEMDLNFGLTRKLEEDDGVFIYQAGLSSDKSNKGLLPAAAVIADLVDNVIFIQKLNDDSFWICCVIDSEVAPGGDEVVSKDDLTQKFYDLNELLNGDVKYYADESLHELFAEDFKDIQLEDILDENDIDKPLKTFSHYKIRNLRGVPLPAILLGAFIVVAGSGTYFMTQSSGPLIIDVDPASIQKMDKNEIKKIIAEPKGPTEEEIFLEAKEEEIKWLKQELEDNNPYQIVSTIMEFQRDLPRSYYGWQAATIGYSNLNPEIIEVEWIRESMGTALTLKNSLKNIEDVVFALSGSSAISTHRIKNIPKRVFDDNVLKGISEDPYKNTQLMHDLESMNLIWTLDILESERPRREIIKGVKNKQKAKKKQLVNTGKHFLVKDDKLRSIYLFNEVFEKSKTSIINELKINLIENNWAIKGVLYEK